MDADDVRRLYSSCLQRIRSKQCAIGLCMEHVCGHEQQQEDLLEAVSFYCQRPVCDHGRTLLNLMKWILFMQHSIALGVLLRTHYMQRVESKILDGDPRRKLNLLFWNGCSFLVENCFLCLNLVELCWPRPLQRTGLTLAMLPFSGLLFYNVFYEGSRFRITGISVCYCFVLFLSHWEFACAEHG